MNQNNFMHPILKSPTLLFNTFIMLTKGITSSSSSTMCEDDTFSFRKQNDALNMVCLSMVIIG